MLNKNLQYLRNMKGYTMVQMAAYLNKELKADIESKFYQTKDKVFYYERTANPINPKPEVMAAFCKIFHVTEDELKSRSLKSIDFKERWGVVQVAEEDAAVYSTGKSEVLSSLVELHKKADRIIKLLTKK